MVLVILAQRGDVLIELIVVDAAGLVRKERMFAGLVLTTFLSALAVKTVLPSKRIDFTTVLLPSVIVNVTVAAPVWLLTSV